MRSDGKTRILCEGALFVAMAQVLGFVKLWELPYGGSITFAMLPLFIFSVRWGCRNAFLASFSFGLLQFVFDGGFALSWPSLVGDYILAFGVLGLAGLFQGKRWGILQGRSWAVPHGLRSIMLLALRFGPHICQTSIWA